MKTTIRAMLYLSVSAAGMLSSGHVSAQVAPATAEAEAEASEDSSQQSTLSEIVVTAQKRSENLQRVPVAVSAFDAETLEDANVRDVSEIGRLTPGLVIQRSERIVAPFLRGVGTNVSTVGFESSVAVYLDGVYFPRLPASFLSLSNVDRVEVLKGPQGTLFGRNASGGLIHIITADPSLSAPRLDASLSYGNYDIVNASAYASAPISVNVAASLSANVTKQGDGFGRNINTGNRANFEDNLSFRGKLLFELTDTAEIVLTGYYVRSESGGKGNTYRGTLQGYSTTPFEPLPPLPGFFDQRGNRDQFARSTGHGGSVRVEQDLSFATLTSVTAYQKVEEATVSDADYTVRDEFVADLRSPVKTFTQELQLASSNMRSFQWVAGLFYYNSVAAYDPVVFTGILFPIPLQILGRQKAESYAAYGQGTLRLTDQLGLTLGGRFTRDKIEGNGSISLLIPGAPLVIAPENPQKNENDQTSFRVALDYQVTPDVMVYSSFSRGYKAGTFNILPFDPSPVKPEVIDAYEVGFKSELLDRHVRLNASAFRYDIKDPQVQLIRNSAILVSNAEKARVEGVEVDLQVAPTRGLTTRFAATYLDARYQRYVGAPSNPPNFNPPYGTITPALLIDASGNRMLRAPKLSLSTGINYAVDTSLGELQIDVSYSYNSDFFFEPDNIISQSSFGLLDSKVQLQLTPQLAFSVWGKNLTNEYYYSDVASQSGPAGYAYIGAPPRTYGATIDFSL